jgi:hypothetical protein
VSKGIGFRAQSGRSSPLEQPGGAPQPSLVRVIVALTDEIRQLAGRPVPAAIDSPNAVLLANAAATRAIGSGESPVHVPAPPSPKGVENLNGFRGSRFKSRRPDQVDVTLRDGGCNRNRVATRRRADRRVKDRALWLNKLSDRGARFRADALYAEISSASCDRRRRRSWSPKHSGTRRGRSSARFHSLDPCASHCCSPP